jgi:nucleotide-binding universal stress UspA family protein
LQALRFGAWLAGAHGAEVVAVLAWTPPGGDLADRSHPSGYLRGVWRNAARQRLVTAVGLALGGPPAGITFSSQIRRAEPGPALVSSADRPGDVLVIGAGRRGPLVRIFGCGICRYCVAHATCPVITVPPSPLERASRGLRGWMLRHRGLDARELTCPQDAGPAI